MLVHSFSQIIAKREIQRIDTIVLVFVRAMLTFIFLAAYLFTTTTLAIPGKSVAIILLIVPLFPAVLQFIILYKAFKYIDISKAYIIRSIVPIATWLPAWVLFRETLTPLQIIGGLLILVGVSVVMFFKNMKGKHNK